jgi:hypothetical protein
MPTVSSTPAGDDAKSDRELAPRGRSGRRAWLIVGLLFLLLVATHATWGWLEQRRLDRRLASLHAAGEPIYAADFDSPAPAADENAADDILAGWAILNRSEERRALDEMTARYIVSLPLSDAEQKAIARMIEANRSGLALIDSGIAKPQARWPGDLSQPLMLQDASWLTAARGTANVLQSDAQLAAQSGRYGDALARIGQMLTLARHVDRHPTMIAHLVATGITAAAASTAEQIAYDLRVGGDDVVAKRLIGVLLDDEAGRAGFVRAMRGERRDHWMLIGKLPDTSVGANVGISNSPAAGPSMKGRLVGYFIKPMLMDNAEMAVRTDTALLQAFERTSDLPGLRADPAAPALLAEIDRSPKWYLFASLFVAHSPERLAQTEYRAATERRLAAVALAMRLYALDQGGRRPQTLSELVPAYLPSLPRDPMAAGGMALRYVPGGERPIVYSVGDDASDNGGSEQLRPGIRVMQYPGEPVPRWNAKDAVLHLKRQPRYFPPDDGQP